MKVALVHDFLMQYGGAERVLECLHQLYPDAPVYTLLSDSTALPPAYRDWDIRPVCFLQRSAPAIRSKYKALFPIYTRFIDGLDLSQYDLVISNSYAYAHGVRVPDWTCHVSYCHTPMRFVWFQEEQYRAGIPRAIAPVYSAAIRALRRWDLEASRRPFRYATNCARMARRIETAYARTAEVIYPPIMLPREAPIASNGDYYLVVARLVHPYKRVDLAIAACERLGLPLKIAGDGEDRAYFERMAGSHTEFLGQLDDRALAAAYRGCKGLLMPWDEDFGLAPLEANLFGKPVLAYRQSGVVDSQVEGVTAQFFDDLGAETIVNALREFDGRHWDGDAIRKSAARFTPEGFCQSMNSFVTESLDTFSGAAVAA